MFSFNVNTMAIIIRGGGFNDISMAIVIAMLR